MTTTEFIEMLREADPNGTAHVRMPGGGVPLFAEHKPGYWDGAYPMMKDGKYHTTIAGSKVDIYMETPYDIIWECKGDMELIKEKFSFDYSGYSNESQRTERVDNFWKWVEKEAKIAADIEEENLREWINKLRKLVDQKSIDTFVYNRDTWQWKGYSEGIEIHGQLCGGEIKAVQKGHMFELSEETEKTRTFKLK